AAQSERLGHDSYDVGLRDGLAAADGQRVVGVGQLGQLRRHEQVTLDRAQGGERARIADAAGLDLLADHALARPGRVLAFARRGAAGGAEDQGGGRPPTILHREGAAAGAGEGAGGAEGRAARNSSRSRVHAVWYASAHAPEARSSGATSAN